MNFKQWQGRAVDAEKRIRELEAEVERLRGALSHDIDSANRVEELKLDLQRLDIAHDKIRAEYAEACKDLFNARAEVERLREMCRDAGRCIEEIIPNKFSHYAPMAELFQSECLTLRDHATKLIQAADAAKETK